MLCTVRFREAARLGSMHPPAEHVTPRHREHFAHLPPESLWHPAVDRRPDHATSGHSASGSRRLIESRRFIVDLSDLYDFLSRRTPASGIQRLLLAFATRAQFWTRATRSSSDTGTRSSANTGHSRARLPTDDAAALQKRLRLPRAILATPDKHANPTLRADLVQSEAPCATRPFPRDRRPRPSTSSRTAHDCFRVSRGGRPAQPRFRLVARCGQDAVLGTSRRSRPRSVRPIFLVHDLIPLPDDVEDPCRVESAGASTSGSSARPGWETVFSSIRPPPSGTCAPTCGKPRPVLLPGSERNHPRSCAALCSQDPTPPPDGRGGPPLAAPSRWSSAPSRGRKNGNHA